MYEDNNQTNSFGSDNTNNTANMNNTTGTTGSTYGPSSYSNYNFNQSYQNQGTPFPNTQPVKPKKEKKPGKAAGVFKKILLAAVLGIFFGTCAGAAFYGFNRYFGVASTPQITQGTALDKQDTTDLTKEKETEASTSNTVNTEVSKVIESDISEVVESVMPSMVSVTNKSIVNYNYWGRVFSEEQEGRGSGIIVGQNDTELLIVTNYHVIDGANSLEITFTDDQVYQAEVKGTNKNMDLAVVAVKLADMEESTLSEIKIATLGDSDSLKLGEPVIAIGNALGYGQSVTNGIVSALDREIEMEDGSTGTFVQTNAAINPGNSGGALLNYNGEVIGINSSKIGGSTVEGMGYAIPISSAKPIIAELMLKDTKTRVSNEDDIGYIGIQPANVADGMPAGVYVAKVYEGTPAEEAGIRTGDIIVGIDGEEITEYADLQKALTYLPGGTHTEIDIKRYGANGFEDVTVEITLGSRADINND